MTYTEKISFQAMQQEIENLEKQLEESILDGDNMGSVALCDELCELKYKYILQIVFSPGTIEKAIGTTEYTSVNTALNNTVICLKIMKDEPEMLEQGIQPEDIAQLIIKCYNGGEKGENRK